MTGKLPGLRYNTWDALVSGAFRDPPPVEWTTYSATINCPPHMATARCMGHDLEVRFTTSMRWHALMDGQTVHQDCANLLEAQGVAERYARRTP